MAISMDTVIKALLSVPEKRLKLIDIVKHVTNKDGQVDLEMVRTIEKEIKLAEAEVEAYIKSTHNAFHALKELSAGTALMRDWDDDE